MDESRFCVPVDVRRVCSALRDKEDASKAVPKEITAFASNSKRLALGELAGKDSVAAMIAAFREGVFDAVIPVVVRTGTEYGNPGFIEKNMAVVRSKIGEVASKPIVVEDFEFWHALNGRFVSELSRRFGFYSPCPGCHLYLHAMRIPLALLLGAKSVVSGERESHDGKEKINQLSFSLDYHEKLTALWGVKLALPLHHISAESKIDELVGGGCSGRDQFSCVFSGNYRTPSGDIGVPVAEVKRFYAEYGFPTTKKIIEELLKNPQAKVIALAKESFK
jgi:hypothetical protein